MRGTHVDAVVDVASMSYPWVAAALDELDAAHWTFVSSINAYADHGARGRTEAAATLPPLAEPVTGRATDDPDTYGRVKVACENAVRERFGARALVVRGGLMTGPGDPTGRFGYWAQRFARGGRAVVPDVPGQPFQHVDVRDLAAWTVDCAEAGRGGTFNGVGPAAPLPDVLARMAEGYDVELVPVAPAPLEAHGVQPWGGEKSLPLWTPPGKEGFLDLDVSAALAAGLRPRPLADTVAAARENVRSPDFPPAGLTDAEESELLDLARPGRPR